MTTGNGPTGSLWPEVLAGRQKRIDDAKESISLLLPIEEVTRPETVLGGVRESVAALTVLAGCEGSRPTIEPLLGLLDRAVERLDAMLAASHWQFGVALLSWINTVECCGLLEGYLEKTPGVEWFKVLIKHVRGLDENQRRTATFAAIAMDQIDLVPNLIQGGKLPASIKPNQTFLFNTQGFLRYLAVAKMTGAPAEDVKPAWIDYVRTFPHQLESERGVWSDLLWGARIYYHDFEKRPVAEAAEALRALIATL